jgi:hypothetical protein
MDHKGKVQGQPQSQPQPRRSFTETRKRTLYHGEAANRDAFLCASGARVIVQIPLPPALIQP